MKLKDFMANTLPRAKKSKKKHTPLNNTLNNFSSGGGTTAHKKDNLNRENGGIQWTHQSVGVIVPEHRPFLRELRGGGGGGGGGGIVGGNNYSISGNEHPPPQQQQQQRNRGYSCDFTHTGRPNHFHYPDKHSQIDAVNFNIKTPDRPRKCGCYKHSSPCSSPESWNVPPSPSPGDGNFNTIPRCRTRIRTNPWLPSPRASPTPSSSSSPIPSPSPSSHPDNSRRWMFPDSTTNQIASSMSHDFIDQSNRARRDSVDSSPSSSTDADSLLQTSFSSDISTDNSVTANIIREQSYSCPAQDAMTTSPRYTTSPWMTTGDTTSSSEDYDDVIENRGERKDRKSRKTRDKLLKSPEYFQPIEEEEFYSQPPLSYNRFDTRFDLFRENDSNDSDGTLRGDETDMFLCEDTKLFSDTSPGAGYEFQNISKNNVDVVDNNKENDLSNLHNSPKNNSKVDRDNVMLESMDSAYDTSSFSEKGSAVAANNNNRGLGEIRSSLQEKVLRLREEKYIVDEKIRQAQEEERIRQQERMKFQKQVTMLRKQILLRTLQDLKRKLENQSQRLQTTYDNVMGMQWERARCRKRFASITPNLPRRNVVGNKESPF